MKKKLSITWIIVSLCLILVMVPVLSSYFYFSHIVYGRLETTAKETASFYIGQYVKDIGLGLDALKNSVYYLATDPNTQQMMRSEEVPSQLERLTTEEGLSKALLLNQIPNSNIVTGIYLVKDNKQYLSVLRSGAFQGTAQRIMDIAKSCGDYNSSRDLYLSPDYPGYCYFIVDYTDLETMKPLGKIIMEINPSNFIDTSLITPIYKHAAVVLKNSSGEIIAQNAATKDFKGAFPEQDGYVTIKDEKYYHTGKELQSCRVQVDLFIPKGEIFEAIDDTMKASLMFTCMILLLTLGAGIFALYLLFHPFKQMLANLKSLADGNLAVRMDPTPYSETNQMADAFNHMAGRLSVLFDEVYTKGILLRDAQFRLLESQIRPHFIFNILELVNMRCMEAGQYGICKTVSNLAELLRANVMHKQDQMITLENELKYVRYYLELQKERFQEKLDYSIELEDPEILRTYLPKLTIQPLVENSIVHGLENKREGGFVKICIWEETDGIFVRVIDNGVGFQTEELDLRASREKDRKGPRNHVALYNINRRLQLLYGQQYEMKIESVCGKGTSILVVIPLDLEGSYTTKDEEEGMIKHVEGDDCG